MRINALLFLLSLPISWISAQTASLPLQEKLKKPVYVVLDEEFGEDYNTLIQETMATYWVLSEYQFIETSEVPLLREDGNNLFLMLVKGEGIDADVREYKHVLTLAHYARTGRYRNNITGVPLDLESTQDARLTMIHGARLLQEKLRFELAKDAGEAEDLESWLEARRDRLKESTLVLSREFVDMESSELPAVYSGKVDWVSSKEFEALLQAPQPGVAYAMVHGYKIPGGYVIEKSIVESLSGELLYFATAGSPNAQGKFSKKDFKALE
ncbi:MAG: hypothetical protein GC205_00935 [Bacteroidetes bacterium]|nr:hypothetical protein [Bacteroidota bacterium]